MHEASERVRENERKCGANEDKLAKRRAHLGRVAALASGSPLAQAFLSRAKCACAVTVAAAAAASTERT